MDDLEKWIVYRHRKDKTIAHMKRLFPAPFYKKFSFDKGTYNKIIIGNAIPKSGTYLIESTVREIVDVNSLSSASDNRLHIMMNSYQRITPDSDLKEVPAHATTSMARLLEGQSVAAHFPYSRLVANFFKSQTKFKHVFLFRDIRDILCSYVNFVTNSNNFAQNKATRSQQELFRKLGFEGAILETMKVFTPKFFSQYLPWLDDENTLSISFEELIENLENSEMSTNNTLSRLTNFLEIDINSDYLGKKILGRGHTSSNVKNKVAQYENLFTTLVKDRFHEQGYEAVNKEFGYD